MQATLTLQLSSTNNLRYVERQDNAVDGSPSTNRAPILPQVLYAINTVPALAAIQAANFVWNPSSPLPVILNNNQNQLRLQELLDDLGNLTYILFDESMQPGTTAKAHILSGDGDWETIKSRSVSTSDYRTQQITLFQNRSIMRWYSGDAVSGGWTASGSGANSVATFNVPTKTITLHTLTGIDLNLIKPIGILSWGNYLLFFTETNLYWSSPLDFKNFTPAIGAGGTTKITEAQGPLLAIVPTSRGLLIYCRKNIVACSYSGDAANPWIFNEVAGSCGLLINKGEPLVTGNEQSAVQVAYTEAGLKIVSMEQVDDAWPELNQVLSTDYTEHRDVGASQITIYSYPRDAVDNNSYRQTKVRRLYMYGEWLFALIGQAGPNSATEKYNRLLGYNTQTQETVWVEGDICALAPSINVYKPPISTVGQHLKADNVPRSFTLLRRRAASEEPKYRTVVLDLVGTPPASVPSEGAWDFSEPQVVVGRIKMRKGRKTRLQGVKFVGRISRLPTDQGVDIATRLKVFGVSVLGVHVVRKEFIYVPATGMYAGDLTGSDIKLELVGRHFSLTEAQLYLSDGGSE
jgi:hypothetical protein